MYIISLINSCFADRPVQRIQVLRAGDQYVPFLISEHNFDTAFVRGRPLHAFGDIRLFATERGDYMAAWLRADTVRQRTRERACAYAVEGIPGLWIMLLFN